MILKVEETNIAKEAIVIEAIPEPYSMVANNMCKPQDLEPFVISYSINQPANSQL